MWEKLEIEIETNKIKYTRFSSEGLRDFEKIEIWIISDEYSLEYLGDSGSAIQFIRKISEKISNSDKLSKLEKEIKNGGTNAVFFSLSFSEEVCYKILDVLKEKIGESLTFWLY